MATIKALQKNYPRPGNVPVADGTKPKQCPKCKRWFAAVPRARMCYDCLPTARARAVTRAKMIKLSPAKTRVKKGENRLAVLTGCPSDLSTSMARSAAFEERLMWISQGCKYPAQQQAEPLAGARRHPYAKARPDDSGYCYGPCNCQCHVKAYEANREGVMQ